MSMGLCFQGKRMQHHRDGKPAHFPLQQTLMPKFYSLAWHPGFLTILNFSFKLFFSQVLSPSVTYCFTSSQSLPKVISLGLNCHPLAILIHSIHLINSVQFSHSVMSDSLWPHEPQHARPPCPSQTPRDYSNSCPSSQ